jgi:putative transposase
MKTLQGEYFNLLARESWQFIETIVHRGHLGRPPKWTVREIFSAILYVARSGCQWRLLPSRFPPWKTVHDYFRKWRDDGTWDVINRRTHALLRLGLGRNKDPSEIIIDAQSAKTTAIADSRGFDGHKMVKGRKRTIVVDVLGFVMAVSVADANHHDSKLAEDALRKIRKPFRLHVCFADQAYRGQICNWSFRILGIAIKLVKRSTDPNKIVTAKRWIVERTFSWLLTYRRLTIDYERNATSEEAWIKVANMAIGLRRLARPA